MSITESKISVTTSKIDFSTIRTTIEEELIKNGFIIKLILSSDSILNYSISKIGYKSSLNIEKSRNSISDIEISIDHKKGTRTKYQYKRKNSGSSIFSRYWYIIVFSSIFYAAATMINRYFVRINENYSQMDQIVLSVSSLSIIVFIWIFVIPKIRQRDNVRKKSLDQYLLKLIGNRLSEVNKENTLNSVIRCWSCFREVSGIENYCDDCGVKLN